MIDGLHHLAIKVRDLAAAEAFYLGVLGLPLDRRWLDDAGAPRSIWARLDARSFLAIERVAEGESTGSHVLALAIDAAAREPWRATLESAGFPVVRETPYTIYVRDPEGHLVGLSHWPHGS